MPDVLRNKLIKAQKDHQCNGCYDTIKKGEVYHGSVNVDGGKIYTFKTCAICEWIIKKMDINEEIFSGELEDYQTNYGLDIPKNLKLEQS